MARGAGVDGEGGGVANPNLEAALAAVAAAAAQQQRLQQQQQQAAAVAVKTEIKTEM
jgi:hypothetical protein